MRRILAQTCSQSVEVFAFRNNIVRYGVFENTAHFTLQGSVVFCGTLLQTLHDVIVQFSDVNRRHGPCPFRVNGSKMLSKE